MPRATKQEADNDSTTSDPEPEPITEAAGPVYLSTDDPARFLDRYDVALLGIFNRLRRVEPGRTAEAHLGTALKMARQAVLEDHDGDQSHTTR